MKNIYVLKDKDGSYFCQHSVNEDRRTVQMGLAYQTSSIDNARIYASVHNLEIYQLQPIKLNP